ncbi:MAG: hypothetical protein ACREJO_13385 [Phycisphaerales bacterium]
MGKATCFVIMPISEQRLPDGSIVSKEDLRQRYSDLIREAIIKAAPDVEVVRADEVSAPGTITSDILMRLMYSDFVIADVSYPNPNVYYELGLRHACRSGTILIKEQQSGHSPFDIASLRHIQYTNTTSGLQKLSAELATQIQWLRDHPQQPDNHFLELAKVSTFQFPNFAKTDPQAEMLTAMLAIVQTPELLEMFGRQERGETLSPHETIATLAKYPDVFKIAIKALANTGQLQLDGGHGKPPIVVTKPIKRQRR